MATYSGIKQSVATAAGVGGGGLDVYATIDDLPTSGLTAGDQAYISATSRLYVSNGSGWYNIGLVNATPTLTIDPSGTIVLSPIGETTTITLTATDSDNSVANLTYSVDSDGSFAGLGTISQDSSVFTITPLSSANATTTTAALTFKAFDGINFGSGAASITLNFKLEYSNYTSFLLQTDDTATDNQVDASTNNYTITEYGNVTSTAVTPHHPGGYSTYFDGAGDHLKIASSADFNLNNTAFTIEGWFYATAPASSEHIWASVIDANNRESFYLSDSTTLNWYVNGSTRISATITANEWHHFSICDNGGTTTLYLNGLSQGTWASTYTNGNRVVWLGTYNDAGYAPDSFTGYLRDIRFVKGTAVYTANFTPPIAPLTAITNTKLLTCQLPYVADVSTNNHAITVTGDPSIERFNPYEYLGYSKANDGGSVYFDGSGDNFRVADGLNLGTDDFTFEFWIYPDENFTSVSKQFINTEISGTGVGWSFNQNTYGGYNGVTFTYGSYGAYTVGKYINNYWLPQRQWTHLAAQRRSGTIEIYVNGVSKTLTTYNEGGSFSDSENFTGTQAYRTFFDGVKAYVSDVRLVTGSYVYDGDFTLPTAPLTAITNTKLLTCTNRNSVWDKTGISATALVGTADASTTQTKYASSSVYLDGNSDYVSIPASDQLDMGSEDFTVEAWVYPVATSANYPTFIGGVTGWTGGSSAHRFDNTGQAGKFSFHMNPHDPLLTTTNTFSHDQWHHYVLTRSAGQYQLYVNGNFEASTTSALTYNAAFGGMRIGQAAWDGGNGYFSGYVSDARITKGLSRYPFTPSQETLTADSNTFLLACAADTVSVTGDWTVTNGGSAPTVSNFAPFSGMKSLRFTDATTRLLLQHTGTSADYDIGDIDNGAAANWSIEAWVYNLDTSFGDDYWFSSYPAAASAGTFMLGVRSDGDFQLRRHTASSGNQIAGVAELGKWQHHLFTQEYDSSASNTKARLFVDGRSVYDGTQTNTNPYDFGNISIGGRTDTTGPWNGYISNLRIQTGTVANPEAAFSKFTPPTSELLG